MRGKKWGPYLSERQWGTVREDYSENGDAWNFFTHDHARSRAYRWGEDGIAGISDDGQHLCFALALWNGKDAILKERLFGLTNSEGTGMFGGNSNWRGPVWMPVNAMIIRALLQFYLYYGDNFKVECPTGSGKMMNLFEVAKEIAEVCGKRERRDGESRAAIRSGARNFRRRCPTCARRTFPVRVSPSPVTRCTPIWEGMLRWPGCASDSASAACACCWTLFPITPDWITLGWKATPNITSPVRNWT